MDISYNLALELFGLKEPVSKSDILAAFRRLVKCAHPDTGGDEKLFIFITECKDVLLNGNCESKSATTPSNEQTNNENGNNKSEPKDYYITLSDLYNMYYDLPNLRRDYNISEIRCRANLYIYPRFKKRLKKSFVITGSCDFSDLSQFGYVPLKAVIVLPKEFYKYNNFTLKLELLNKSLKMKIAANGIATAKLEKFCFNTIFEIKIVKGNS